VLLDLLLPGPPGTEVCRRLRERSDVPVIMLSAKDTEIDKAVGLELGADDYLTKPFTWPRACRADPGRAAPPGGLIRKCARLPSGETRIRPDSSTGARPVRTAHDLLGALGLAALPSAPGGPCGSGPGPGRGSA